MQTFTDRSQKTKKYQDQTSIGKDLVRAHTDKGPLDFKVPGSIQRYMPEPREHLYVFFFYFLLARRNVFRHALITLLSSHAFCALSTIECELSSSLHAM